MDTGLHSAALQRSVTSRLRTLGVPGIFSWILLVAITADVVDGGAPWVSYVYLAIVVAVRVAIATEYVRCDADGLRWRTIFATHRVAWADVAAIETAVVRNGRGQGWFTFPVATMVVVLGDGSQRNLLASVWTPIMRHAEFIAAARLVSTHDWAEHDIGDVPTPPSRGGVLRGGRGRPGA